MFIVDLVAGALGLVTLFLLIKYGVVPVIRQVMGPRRQISRVLERKRIAETQLEVARLEAEAHRIELEAEREMEAAFDDRLKEKSPER